MYIPTEAENKRLRDGLMDSVSEYFDYPDAGKKFIKDLEFCLKDLNRYHQEKASSTKALLGKLGLKSSAF